MGQEFGTGARPSRAVSACERGKPLRLRLLVVIGLLALLATTPAMGQVSRKSETCKEAHGKVQQDLDNAGRHSDGIPAVDQSHQARGGRDDRQVDDGTTRQDVDGLLEEAQRLKGSRPLH